MRVEIATTSSILSDCGTRPRRCRELGEGKPESLDFLGFTHCCGQYSGGLKIVRLTIKKRMRATLAAVGETLIRQRHEPIPILGRCLGRVVKGYFNYYAVPGKICRSNSFRSELSRAWRHALMRRSQRHRLPWPRYSQLIKKYLPPCRVVHPLSSERF